MCIRDRILREELVRAKVLPEDYDFEAHKELVPMQPGDVPVTYADTSALERDFGYKPSTSLREMCIRDRAYSGGASGLCVEFFRIRQQ